MPIATLAGSAALPGLLLVTGDVSVPGDGRGATGSAAFPGLLLVIGNVSPSGDRGGAVAGTTAGEATGWDIVDVDVLSSERYFWGWHCKSSYVALRTSLKLLLCRN